MTRRTARELAMLTAASLTPGESGAEALDLFFGEEHYGSLASEGEPFTVPPGEAEYSYIRTLVLGVEERRQELDDILRNHARDWKVERLSPVVRAVLHCALYELLYLPDIPPKVSVNEAVELAKKYCAEDVPGFVNAILGAYLRQI